MAVESREMTKPEPRDVAMLDASWAKPQHSILTYAAIALPALVFFSYIPGDL
jgi:hypothetical protein